MDYLIGLDIGTSSIKGILLSVDGAERITGKSQFTYTRKENGGLEIDAEDYITACFSLLGKLAKAVPADGMLRAVCAASASGNLLLLDEDGSPSTPIFNWQDGRVDDEAEKVLGQMDTEAFYDKNGWPFDYKTFPLAMLCWLKCHRPELLKRCGKVCMSTEYLYYRLTGKWGISGSAGTPFYLIDQRNGTYDRKILNALGIGESQLPPVGNVGETVGNVTNEASVCCMLPAGTPVVLGTFDHPSAARGAGVLSEGQMLLSCGTSWVGFYPVRDRQKAIGNKMLVDPFLSPQGCWGAMFSLPSISGRIEWYIRKYIADSGDVFQIFAAEAAKSTPGAGGLAINPAGEPDDETIRKYPKSDIARAIMEGTARLLNEKICELHAGGISAQSAVMVGGPTANPMWIQVIREITGIPVRVMHGAYAGAIGAAMVAGISAGLYEDEAAAFERLREE